jgi:glycosyltransferase involved in cell wall biosynthesis
VVLEAQASGVPVVVSSDGGPREHMVAGCTGAVCYTAGVDEWARAIARVLQGNRIGMGAAGRDYALTRRWAQAMEPLYGAYREVLAAHRHVAPGQTPRLERYDNVNAS